MSEISDLANLIKVLRADDRKFVVMLGAGASISSQVPDARTMMKAVVEQHATSGSGSVEDRFDQLMSGPEDNRRSILKPYLDKTPSSGYRMLAELMRDGYFDTVISFNFDTLLEQALRDAGVHNFATIIRGEFDEDKIPAAVEQPGIKIVKLHGSLKGVSSFVFTREDLVEYPRPIRDTVEKLTGGDILVCGYAYNDQCVITAFSKTGPGNVVVVNPNPNQMLCDVARKRKSQSQHIFSGVGGRFDEFFAGLSAALKPVPPSVAAPARNNPFKYLEAYRAEDQPWFFGREDLVKSVGERLSGGPKERAFFITGGSKVGKTSFVRAGLMPALEPEPLYLRCQANLETWLPTELGRRKHLVDAADLPAALKALAPPSGPRVYLVLDQFERVVRPYQQKARSREDFRALLERLMAMTPEMMTIVYVARSEGDLFLHSLIDLNVASQCVSVRCDAEIVGIVIQRLAEQAAIGIHPEVIEQLKDMSAASDAAEPFTLAHVNAVCHLLCDSGREPNIEALKSVLTAHQDTLNRVINLYDVIGFVEDIPFDAAARALLPRMMKVISAEGRQNLAECLSSHFGELFPPMALAGDKPMVFAGDK